MIILYFTLGLVVGGLLMALYIAWQMSIREREMQRQWNMLFAPQKGKEVVTGFDDDSYLRIVRARDTQNADREKSRGGGVTPPHLHGIDGGRDAGKM